MNDKAELTDLVRIVLDERCHIGSGTQTVEACIATVRLFPLSHEHACPLCRHVSVQRAVK